MRIEDIVKHKEQTFIYMERYVNNGSPSGFDKKYTTSPTTSPRGQTSSFFVKILRFDESIEIETFGTKELGIGVRDFYCHPDNLKEELFQNLKDHYEIVGELEVSPTASGRTVKIIGEGKGFLKLDYLGKLGRISRNLDRDHVVSAFECSRDIKEMILTKKCLPSTSLLDESNGRVAYLPDGNGGFYEFGFLYREEVPFGTNEELYLIPGFSLFGVDVNAPKDRSIVLQLFDKSHKGINDFAYEDVFYPLVSSYFDVLTFSGNALEAHAQNTLVAIDSSFKLRYVVARDMESVDKDTNLKEFLHYKYLPITRGYKYIKEGDYNYVIKHSFMYDFKMGFYLLDPLMEEFKKVPDFDEDKMLNRIKALAKTYINRLPKDYFPEGKWYYYENKIFEPGKKRPYLENTNVRYR